MNKFGSNRAQAAAPRTAAPVAGAGNKPTHVLKMKGEDGKLVTITGLFASKTKSGEDYLSGTDKESGIKYVVYVKSEIKQA
jgi:hypothetical protein